MGRNVQLVGECDSGDIALRGTLEEYLKPASYLALYISVFAYVAFFSLLQSSAE